MSNAICQVIYMQITNSLGVGMRVISLSSIQFIARFQWKYYFIALQEE